MCPSLVPPAIFDFLAPHSSGWAVLLLLTPLVLILIQVWGYRRFLNRLPTGPERHSIAQLFVIGGGIWTLWMTLFALVLLWGDAFQTWNNTVSPACQASAQLTQALGQHILLQSGMLFGASLLGLVGLIILLVAFRRYQRARRAPRLIF